MDCRVGLDLVGLVRLPGLGLDISAARPMRAGVVPGVLARISVNIIGGSYVSIHCLYVQYITRKHFGRNNVHVTLSRVPTWMAHQESRSTISYLVRAASASSSEVVCVYMGWERSAFFVQDGAAQDAHSYCPSPSLAHIRRGGWEAAPCNVWLL